VFKNTVECLYKFVFAPNQFYGIFVAADDNFMVGFTIYYWRYSTWNATRLYLEDIVVTESQRGKGTGKLLFDRTMKHALDENCTGMMWQVLEWNDPAINFYKKYGARLDDEWTNCSLEAEQIKSLVSKT
jgi:GNAT superfamily N-acetyltransferase